MRTTAVHTNFSLNETSLSGALTSGMTLTKGDKALRNIEVKYLPPAGYFGSKDGAPLKISKPEQSHSRTLSSYKFSIIEIQ